MGKTGRTSMKQQRQGGKKTVKPQTITKAVTHIRLTQANPGKLAALDQLAPVFLSLCQQYVTLFCTEEHPDKFYPPVFVTPLSERRHRVASQQPAALPHPCATTRDQ